MEGFANFISDSDAERLVSLFGQKEVSWKALDASFFATRIPISQRTGLSSYKAIAVTPRTLNTEKILVGLIWEALFGQNFRVYHYQLLFELLCRTIRKDDKSRALMHILLILTARAGARWNTRMKSVKTVLSHAGTEIQEKEIDKIKELLPLVLPRKRPKIEELLEVREIEVQMHRPKKKRRIGVGYRDKGSLGSGASPTSSETPLSYFFVREDAFCALANSVRSELHQIFQILKI